MAGFSDNNWNTINKKPSQSPSRFGFPVRRSGSVVIGSFNALKLGKATNSAKHWEFLERCASRYDLLAIQEVTDDLSGVRRLHKSLGPSFELLVSDTTGAAPGSRGLRERLAYLYRPKRIKLQELVSDITMTDQLSSTRCSKTSISGKSSFLNSRRTMKRESEMGKNPMGLATLPIRGS